MAVIISRMYVALSGLEEISIIWRPLCSHCVSLRMLSTLNMFLRTGYSFLLLPNLPLSSPLVWGVEALYCCNRPSLGVELSLLHSSHFSSSLFSSLEMPLSSSPPLIDCHCLRSKYFPIPHCFLGGSLYRILGVQFVVVSLPFQ